MDELMKKASMKTYSEEKNVVVAFHAVSPLYEYLQNLVTPF